MRGKSQCVVEQCKSLSGYRLEIVSTLPTTNVEVTRTRWHGQHSSVVATENEKPRGKTAKVVTVSSRSLQEKISNGTTPTLDTPGKKKMSRRVEYVNWIPTGETFKTVFEEEWIDVAGDSSEEQNTTNAPLHITTMARNNETPAGQM